VANAMNFDWMKKDLELEPSHIACRQHPLFFYLNGSSRLRAAGNPA
jgi:hypothetical protein